MSYIDEDSNLKGFANLGKALIEASVCKPKYIQRLDPKDARKKFADSVLLGLICDVWQLEQTSVRRAIIESVKTYTCEDKD